MDSQSSPHSQIIEIRGPIEDVERRIVRSKICGDTPCGFSDPSSTSKDAKERSSSMRKLVIAIALCVLFMGVEVGGGIKANSLAILTDAAHMLSDVASFAISLFSMWAAGWEATPRQSYGFFRIEILGALVSMQLIWLIAGILVYEAVFRLFHDTDDVNGFLMFIIASVGLVVNISMALLLGHDHSHGHDSHSHGVGHSHGHDNHGHGAGHSHGHDNHGHEHEHEHDHSHDHEHDHSHEHEHPLLNEPKEGAKKKKGRNINLQGAYLHVLGDSVQSIGVMIAGGIIWYKPEWKIADLICTFIFSIVVLGTTFKMLRSILEVLMESTPREIDATRLETGLLEMEEVVAIHELHIWAITVGKVLLACHVKIRPDADAERVLDNVVDYIRKEYNISHVTVQIER